MRFLEKVNIKKRILEMMILGVLFYLSYTAPLTSDDLYYKYKVTENSWLDYLIWVANMGEGRLLGNFSVIFFLKNPMYNVLFKAACAFGIIKCMEELLGIKEIYLSLLVYILILFPSNTMYAQVFVWSAGFHNYMTPILLVLCSLVLLKKYYEATEKNMWKTLIISGSVMIIGFISQFYNEISTVMNIFVMLLISIYLVYNKIPNQIPVFCALIGNILGGSIMFLLPVVTGTAYKKEDYKQVRSSASEVLSQAKTNLWSIGSEVSACFILLSMISFCVLVLLIRKKANNKKELIVNKFMTVILTMFPCYGIMVTIGKDDWITLNHQFVKLLPGISLILYFLITVIIIYRTSFINKNEKFLILSLYGTGLLSFIPLLIVTPVAARVYYFAYICFVGGTVILLKSLLNITQIQQLKELLSGFFGGILLGIMFMLCFIGSEWKVMQEMRNTYIERMAGNDITEIALPILTHDDLLQGEANSNYWAFVLEMYNDNEIEIKWYQWFEWIDNKEE
ncbi:MAG: DUF6056 family protein [Eubacteriales bacterium]